MQLIEVIAAIVGLVVGVIFGYLQVIVPFTRGELKLTRKFPFVVGIDTGESTGTRPGVAGATTPSGGQADHRRVVTILVIDMVGFLAKKLKDEKLVHELIEEQRHILRSIFSKHNGSELTVIGDKSVVEFTTPLEAVMCAIGIQESFEERNSSLPPERWIQLRIGIQTGEVTRVEKGDTIEILGEAVETAFKIEKLADPGWICMTEKVYGQVRNRIEEPTLPIGKSDRKATKLEGMIYRLVLPWQRKSLPLFDRISFSLQRTTSRLLTIAVLIIMTFSAYLIFTREAESGEPIPIAVVDFVNQTNEPELDGLSGMLITSLEQSRKLSVITRSRMFDILKQLGQEDVEKIDETLGREICRHANLEVLVIASIRKFGELYTIDLKVLDPIKNEYIFAVKGDGRGQESIPAIIDDLSEKTRGGLKERNDEIRTANRRISDVTTVNMEAYQHYFQGEQFINSLDFNDAEHEFRKAVALDSTFGLAWYRLAYTLGWNNEKLSRKPLERALDLIDRIPEKERYLVHAEKARSEGGFEQGLEVLREMQKVYPDDKEMLYNIGDWSFHSGELDTAFKYLQTTLTIDPIFERALQHMVWTCKKMERYADMFDYAKRYASVSETDESYHLLGEASFLSDHVEAGLQLLQLLHAVNPKKQDIAASIARLFTYMGAFDRAEAQLRDLLDDTDNPRAVETGYHELVDLNLYRGRYRESLEILDELDLFYRGEEDTASIAITHLLKGLVNIWGWEDTTTARAEIEQTIPYRSNLDSRDYWGLLTYLCLNIGDMAEAEKIAAERGEEITWITPILGVYEQLYAGQCARAESLSVPILSSENSDDLRSALYAALLECQIATDNWEGAIGTISGIQSHYIAGIVSEVYYPRSFYLLGRCYEQMGNKAQALENYEKFLEIWRNADEDLPPLQDAKIRYTNLKENIIS